MSNQLAIGLKMFLFLSFLLLFGFYVEDVFKKFDRKDTSFMLSKSEPGPRKSPTVTICIENSAYRLNQHFNLQLGKNWPQFFLWATLKKTSFAYIGDITDIVTLEKGQNRYKSSFILVEEFSTVLNGICYTLGMDYKQNIGDIFNVALNYVNQSDILPIRVSFTSFENRLGVIAPIWIDGLEYTVESQCGSKVPYISLTMHETTELGLKGTCTDTSQYPTAYHCIGRTFLNQTCVPSPASNSHI